MRPFRDYTTVHKVEDIYTLLDRLEAALVILSKTNEGQEVLDTFMERAARIVELAEDAAREHPLD